MKHQHIDSSGAFDCLIGSACKLPDAGKQFDAMLGALTDVSKAYQDLFDVMPVAWQTYDDIVSAAMQVAKGVPQ